MSKHEFYNKDNRKNPIQNQNKEIRGKDQNKEIRGKGVQRVINALGTDEEEEEKTEISTEQLSRSGIHRTMTLCFYQSVTSKIYNWNCHGNSTVQIGGES